MKRELEAAARLQGTSTSGFIVSSARRAAQTLVRKEVIRLNRADSIAVAEGLLNPPGMNAAMRRALERRQLVESR